MLTLCCKKSIQINKHFKKECPQCGNEILYTTQKALDISIKENKVCLKCSINKPKTKEKMQKSQTGNNNNMYGKSVYNVWLQKYGKEIANQKLEKFKQKISIKTKGKNNPMFGKPSPQGSGNGWSGHYKNIYFRSLLELYYLIYLIDNHIKFENGELKKHAIQYTMDGLNRNYFPDFYLIDSKETIEIKPKNLIGSYQNKLKFEAAKNKLGNKYVILTEDEITKIDIKRLWDLYKCKELQFDERYVSKFEQYYAEKNNRKSP